MPLSSDDAPALNEHVATLQFAVNEATGGLFGVGVPPVKPIYRSRFGEPVPTEDTLAVEALFRIALVTVPADAPGLSCRKSAATPATCGLAIEVPEIEFVAVAPVYQADVMPLPGAKTSRQVP